MKEADDFVGFKMLKDKSFVLCIFGDPINYLKRYIESKRKQATGTGHRTSHQ
jgi:hypothetical protein